MCGSYDCWIGYNDLASEGSFAWLHGDSTYINFNTGEPNNAHYREDCIHMRGSQNSSTWNDNYCSDVQRFVCEADPYNECLQCPAGEVSSAGSVQCIAAGEITTIAGKDTSGSNFDTGLAVASSIDSPRSIAIDLSGNIHFAEQNNHRIRKITVSTGIISTAVGTGAAGYSGDNDAASSAQLSYPTGIAFDTSGDNYPLDLCITQYTRLLYLFYTQVTGTSPTLATVVSVRYLRPAAKSRQLSGPAAMATTAISKRPNRLD